MDVIKADPNRVDLYDHLRGICESQTAKRGVYVKNAIRMAALAAVAVPAASVGQQAMGAWTFRAIVDPMSDASRGIASTAASNPVVMVVKCDSNGDNKIYISFLAKSYLGALSRNKIRPIKFRIDDSPPEDLSGYYDDNTANVFDVNPENAGGRFLARVAGGQKLTVQVSKYDYETVTSVIDVTGARKALQEVAKTCKDNSMLSALS